MAEGRTRAGPTMSRSRGGAARQAAGRAGRSSPTTASARPLARRRSTAGPAGVIFWRTPATTPARRRTIRLLVGGWLTLGDIYVNDAFSGGAPRATPRPRPRASPARLCRAFDAKAELEALIVGGARQPSVGARGIVGGIERFPTKPRPSEGTSSATARRHGDRRRHANTFLFAQVKVGASYCERDMAETARWRSSLAGNGRLRAACCRSTSSP